MAVVQDSVAEKVGEGSVVGYVAAGNCHCSGRSWFVVDIGTMSFVDLGDLGGLGDLGDLGDGSLVVKAVLLEKNEQYLRVASGPW
jgi:hypothetical protein